MGGRATRPALFMFRTPLMEEFAMLASVLRQLGGRLRHPDAERGASLVEYALLLALIAIVCVAAISFFGKSTSSTFSADTVSMFINP